MKTYEIIQQKKKEENFQLGRVIHMADKASSTGILKPELHVTVQEQPYMQSGDVAVMQPLSLSLSLSLSLYVTVLQN